jgi:hypothetical protein
MTNESKDNSFPELKNKNTLNIIKMSEENNNSLKINILKKSIAEFSPRYEIKEDQPLKNYEIKTSKTLVQADSMILYKNRIKNIQMKNKKEKDSSDIFSLDCNEKTSDTHSLLNNLKMKSKIPTGKGLNSSLGNNEGGGNKMKLKKKKAKKVTFKKKFVSYVDIESYKKYNVDNSIFNDNNKTETKCSCEIF